jgi:hypothetical protein
MYVYTVCNYAYLEAKHVYLYQCSCLCTTKYIPRTHTYINSCVLMCFPELVPICLYKGMTPWSGPHRGVFKTALEWINKLMLKKRLKISWPFFHSSMYTDFLSFWIALPGLLFLCLLCSLFLLCIVLPEVNITEKDRRRVCPGIHKTSLSAEIVLKIVLRGVGRGEGYNYGNCSFCHRGINHGM